MGNAIDRGAYGNRLEDEARLFYTAITRAERLLYLTGSEIHPGLKNKKKRRKLNLLTAFNQFWMINWMESSILQVVSRPY